MLVKYLFKNAFDIYTFRHNGSGFQSSEKTMYLMSIASAAPIFFTVLRGTEFIAFAMVVVFTNLLLAFLLKLFMKDVRKVNAIIVAIFGLNCVRAVYMLITGHYVQDDLRFITMIWEIFAIVNVLRKIDQFKE